LLCAAKPWDDGDWNKATLPLTSGRISASSTYPARIARIGDKIQPQKALQKPQKPFWLQFQSLLFNLKLLLEGK